MKKKGFLEGLRDESRKLKSNMERNMGRPSGARRRRKRRRAVW